MPKRVGKYELGKQLGSGSFSKVMLGTDTESGKVFAVKIIDKALLVKSHVEQQLKREIAIMKLLDHPHVVVMNDVLQTGSNIYLVLDYLPGGDLFDRLDSAKRFDEAQARTYFQQLMYGLSYLHTNDIAHRDLKPENLLLDKAAADGILKLADFGFSRLLNTQQLLQTVCGTPNYMAPEVLKEQGYDGKAADLWSSGVILYAMMAGYLPFDDPNTNVLCDKIEAGDYRMSRKFTEDGKNMVGRMLTVEPKERITMAGIWEHAFTKPGLDDKMVKYQKAQDPTEEQTANAFTDVDK